jgi:cytochrome b subunit of formate dehydrogenase
MVLSALLFLVVVRAAAQDPDNCLFCHQYHGLSRYDPNSASLHVFYVNPEYVRSSMGPHARLACTDCHPREEVAVVPHRPVSRVNCTQTCHLQDPTGIARRYTHENVEQMLQQSVHAYDVLNKLEFTGGPLLRPQQSRCLYCHDEPYFRGPTGLISAMVSATAQQFDRCDTCHAEQIRVDTGYYLRHISARLEPARPTLEMAQACAVCHSDPEVRKQFTRNGRPMPDAVASFVRSFHGKAALLGDASTANCISCHVAKRANAHLMLGHENPASSVSPQRVADSCRSVQCHPGADPRIAAAGVHVDLAAFRGTLEYFLAGAFILFTVITFGPSMLIVVLELFAIVIGRQHPGSEKLEALAERVWAHPDGRRRLTRFTPGQRVQHWLLVVLFTVLALTGFPLKFADQHWARMMIDLFGGLGTARTIHHWAGFALVVGLAFHLLYVLATFIQHRRAVRHAGERESLATSVQKLPMWVTPLDMRQMLHLFAYLLHLRHDRPVFDRFNVKEKFEYFGVFWGTVLLGVTGALLWGEQIASHYFTGRALNLALIAHTYEAFLAVIHVGILHIINVVLHPLVFPLSPATITGRTPIPLLAEEHTGQVLRVAREVGIATEGVGHD